MEKNLLLTAFKNTLLKFYWLLAINILVPTVFFVWRNMLSNYFGLLGAIFLSLFATVLGLSIGGVPVEYNRLKRLAAGLHVSDNR